MKIAAKLNPTRLLKSDRKGVALVTVLTVMALTTILVLTFFSLASSEHRASNTYSHGLQAQQVGEQAINLVIAQIRQATSVGRDMAWASQPGAIRVWEQSGQKGYAFKLYSDDVMKTLDWEDFRNDFRDLENWSSQPDHFVDLNEPVIRGEKVYYPIVHPLASTEPKWPKPLGDDKDGVEGFWYNRTDKGTKVRLTDSSEIGVKAAKIMGSEDHVAMPVTWIYQLADGTLGVLDKSGSGGSNPGYQFRPISPGGRPEAINPIVARFAFWADDETTKLNINTHAGGLAWDVPKAGGDMDMAMGKYQPAQKEWQRYPGHPASTHLSPALAPGVLDIVNDQRAMEMLYGVVPRVVGGGSKSGTRIIDTRDPKENNGLIADKEPLFPSLDDVIMRSDRTPHHFPDAKGKAIPASQLSEYLERAKFFITANSRAPETNMFNKPRVAIWPIYNAEYKLEPEVGDDKDKDPYLTYLTPFDRLIHFCSSLGKPDPRVDQKYEYIFKREKADSPTYDYEKIPRNEQLYKYLVSMMNEEVPGYGESFASKYGPAGAQQIITLIFDYIRSTNLHDDTLFTEDFQEAFLKKNTSKHLTYTNPRDGNKGNLGFGLKGHGQVTPIRIPAEGPGGIDTKGMGRFFTLSGADIVVGCVAQTGFMAAELYPGTVSYRNRHNTAGSGNAYTNLPPLPPGADDAVDDDGNYVNRGFWPEWLKSLELRAEADEVDKPPGYVSPLRLEFVAAFDETNWNWNLAFLDSGYRDAVLEDPTANKFVRKDPMEMDYEVMRLKDREEDAEGTVLVRGEKMVQAIFTFSMYCPSIGWGSINPNMQIEIEAQNGMTFQSSAYRFLGWDGQGANPDNNNRTFVWATNWIKPHREGGVRAWGGLLPFMYAFQARDSLGEQAPNNRASVWWQLWNNGKRTTSQSIRSRLTPLDRGYNHIENALQSVRGIRDIGGSASDVAQAYRYDLVTYPFKIYDDEGLNFDGGKVQFRIYDGGDYCENSYQDDKDQSDTDSLVQTITLDFDPFGFPFQEVNMSPGRKGHVNEFDDLSSDSNTVLQDASMTADPANPWSTPKSSAARRGGSWRNSNPRGETWFAGGEDDGGNARGRMADASLHWNGRYLKDGDIVQSLAVPHGDMRMVAAKAEIKPSDNLIVKHRKYGSDKMAHSLTNAEGDAMAGFKAQSDRDYLIVTGLPGNNPYRNQIPLPFASEKSNDVQLHGDFDNGSGTMIDGPYINKPDEGNVHALKTRFTQEVVDYWDSRRDYGDFPYFSHPEKAESGGPSYFSPNRIVSGPGMFGSLPTASLANPPKPWQTLLFRPDVSGNGYTTHPGAKSPPDHLIMDLFWMPVVEPYAISEPLSTGGKVNMNYQIVPFLHVHRDTALRGVFRSEFMVCIPNQWHGSYKHNNGRGQGYHWRDNPYGGALQGLRLRAAIVEDATLAQFDERFDRGLEIFKSATEICEIHLIPQEISERLSLGQKGSIGTYTPTVDQMRTGKYWRDHSLVGDNSRERPYTNIQTRLTTKSNTFLVHYRAQVVKQSRRNSDADYGEWRPEVDTVQAEYRGSSMVERFVDPNSDEIPDFAMKRDATLDEFYRYRVVNPRRFAP